MYRKKYDYQDDDYTSIYKTEIIEIHIDTLQVLQYLLKELR